MNVRNRPSSLQRVFEPIFGRRWHIVLLLIPLVVAWPVVAFWPHIALDPADFVEEWIKLSLTTIIFFFIIEIVQERRRTELSRQDFESFRKSHLVAPLYKAVGQLELIQAKLNPGDSADISDELLTASRHVEHVRSALATADALAADPRHHGQFAGANPDRVAVLADMLTDLARTRTWGVAAIEDLQSTARRLKQLATQFEHQGEET